ncbi:hypothetical protein H310_12200 [Aphanomyces invadans]|uniref:Uncharacterized protein n=1 Tax=Aphanomyces invadans TaxID=157072 RepID=A0A024TIG6_9STRA|nr:hypothetical protein H310_12200 [Aphanomyces invadans]ETV93848.1 hypothetical protein H310_12200 [Aphanomyces invadans]|eukprot:XP_008877408.1 hypothetical protein H310_12200 [Aphanomyces invadans]
MCFSSTSTSRIGPFNLKATGRVFDRSPKPWRAGPRELGGASRRRTPWRFCDALLCREGIWRLQLCTHEIFTVRDITGHGIFTCRLPRKRWLSKNEVHRAFSLSLTREMWMHEVVLSHAEVRGAEVGRRGPLLVKDPVVSAECDTLVQAQAHLLPTSWNGFNAR